MKFRKILVILFLLSRFIGFCQESANRIVFQANFNHGFIIPHHASLQYLIQKHVNSSDLRIGFQANGKKAWHRMYRLPEIGFGLFVADLGNRQYLGQALAGYGFMKLSLYENHRSNVYYSLGGGIVDVNRHFDALDNPMNYAIGSRFNAFINLEFVGSMSITKNISAGTGIRFIHFSNGAMKVPNLGLNIPSFSFSASYHPETENSFIRQPGQKESFAFSKKFQFQVFYTQSVKEISPPGGRKYYISGMSINTGRSLNAKRILRAGADVFYDPSVSIQVKPDSGAEDNSNRFRAGVYAEHDLVFGNIYFVLQPGYYLINPLHAKEGNFYARFGLMYRNKGMSIRLCLKSHRTVADGIELGVGFTFLNDH